MKKNQTLLYGVIAVVVIGIIYLILKNNPTTPTSTTPTLTPAPTVYTTPAATATNAPSQATIQSLTVTLNSQNNSDESGTVILTEKNGKTTVAVSLTGQPKGLSQPAHIHAGTCPSPGAVKYPLKDIVAGKSTTVLDVTLSQLKGMLPLAINVHQSATEISKYVACGDVKF